MLQNQNFNPFEQYADFGILRYLSVCKENKAMEFSLFVHFCLRSSVSEEKFESGLNNLLYHSLVKREARKIEAKIPDVLKNADEKIFSLCALTSEGKTFYSLLKKNFGN
ncbi:hypothetical protein COS75_00390 [Candidatus Pacearchaeota archaeon CG06_land_8_20_14_3_00_35_12]|nr:MAG: hypothetical protein COS75_00390 [Candidatus Pacearchaeota archaeon CG06_land_8_20_14_3_00_35_12]